MQVKMTGLNKLTVKLSKGTDLTPVKAIVKQNGDELNQDMKKQTQSSFRKGYSQGTTARSINTVITDDGLTAAVGPTTEYAPYVEYGTRFMEPEPFVAPAFARQKEKFINDLKKVCS